MSRLQSNHVKMNKIHVKYSLIIIALLVVFNSFMHVATEHKRVDNAINL